MSSQLYCVIIKERYNSEGFFNQDLIDDLYFLIRKYENDDNYDVAPSNLTEDLDFWEIPAETLSSFIDDLENVAKDYQFKSSLIEYYRTKDKIIQNLKDGLRKLFIAADKHDGFIKLTWY